MPIKTIKEFLKFCTRCGKCVPLCPSYQVFKEEIFSPRGRIFYLLQDTFHKSFDFCLMCGICERNCPNEVSFPEAYLEILKEKKENSISKEFLKKFASDPLKIFLEINNWLHLISVENRKINSKLKERFSKQGDIVIYYSCDLKYFYPQVLRNFGSILEKYNLNAYMPLEVECCGAPFLNLGYISLLKEKALKNLEVLEKTKGFLIMFCATCLWIFKKIYPQIFKGSVYEDRFKRLAERVISGYRFLSDFAEEEIEKLKNQKKDVIFHLPCHLTEDFNLVKNKLEIKDFCCGSPKASLWLEGFQRRFKKNWIKDLENIDILATFCAGCYLNFNLLLKRPPQIKHWFELL